jgi:hypothetical protein
VRLVFSSVAILFFDIFRFFMASSSCHATTSSIGRVARTRNTRAILEGARNISELPGAASLAIFKAAGFDVSLTSPAVSGWQSATG